MKKQGGDVSGDSRASAAAFQRQLIRLGELLLRTESILDNLHDDGVTVTHINVRCPHYEKPEYMVVIKAQSDAGGLVGFHAAPTFQEAISGALERLLNKSIKWREDTPYGS